MTPSKPLHVSTPLRESTVLSKLTGTKVYLKLDCAQPTGSFKIRGIGHFCKTWAERGCKRFVASSGGNAGLAAAYSARMLGIPATIYVPTSTPAFTVKRLKDEGSDVCVVGEMLLETTKAAKELVKNNPEWVYVSPYDDPLIWEGHKSLVREMKEQMESKPGVLALSVGGGGMLCGVIWGLREVGWDDVPIIALETDGAQSLNAALAAGKLVTLPNITSVATTLGANTVAAEALKLAQEHPVFSVVITDQEAVMAIERFVDDEKILVEPACGAALTAIYSQVVQRLQAEGKLSPRLESIVVIVCGGNNITLPQLQHLKEQLGISKDTQPCDQGLMEGQMAVAVWDVTSQGSSGALRASLQACWKPCAY
ncbi:L-serine dehydratase/L-threonine deaminase [Anolis carolinensis]|uniref:L-serine deaminase n=1 Tax=Anolis carolinensis TaxID=28377 RepID=A0A803T9H3_ANOCA|nr:PREDICTED: L-serine dehydratase/L-threonine deaminase [Anolis carolinensis]|eukprot:XP_003226076.1 PREDICTED: L-serine dehydratase/L-threonine deaminase [Anolis carolinensis]